MLYLLFRILIINYHVKLNFKKNIYSFKIVEKCIKIIFKLIKYCNNIIITDIKLNLYITFISEKINNLFWMYNINRKMYATPKKGNKHSDSKRYTKIVIKRPSGDKNKSFIDL